MDLVYEIVFYQSGAHVVTAAEDAQIARLDKGCKDFVKHRRQIIIDRI